MRDYTRQEVGRLNEVRTNRARLTIQEVTRVFRGDRAAVLTWFAAKPQAFMPDFSPYKVEQVFGADERVEVGFAYPRDREESFLPRP